ncbi:hypothetical protein PFICI_05378 [Pestalotiopsis fici W106-1]|uniref:Major facilitator superfamily (MFS) profile domain-containing protein n=1 Tax=Pestalotiopsis fici (strain W106-1 / CGMCC3.15140) TaxID=1229662 RepID=W3XDK2_PESFW|nr:uncharacterized protein PFICI_05378 [Pestalotiopsis fici W106-1]ETS83502.1 hypothetical protein PFICI_05378 [Pestalotiopsis fici W106-1]
MSPIGAKDGRETPQLPRLAIPAYNKTNPFSATSPTVSATISQLGDIIYPVWTPSSASTTKSPSLRGSGLPPWTPIAAGKSPQIAVGMPIKAVRPPRPISKDPPRPGTASTVSKDPPRPETAASINKELPSPWTSASSIHKELPRPMTASTKRLTLSRYNKTRPIKYGNWKDGEIELVPQPSDDSEDPLNWPLWRKNLNFYALLHMVALVGVSKTMFVTVHSEVALSNGVSYTAAVALTGVPLCVSALSGMLSLVIAKVFGKRPIYLASTLFMFIGTMWGMYVMNSFSQNMASRVFQGLGWGAFDTLVLGSLQDTFFEHELQPRILAVQAVSIAATWGSPLLGGVASVGPRGFCLQYEILSIFLALGTWAVVFGVPESTFERSSISMFSRDSLQSRPRLNWPWIRFSTEAAKDYISRMRPWSFKVSLMDSTLLLRAPRAMMTPTILLLFSVTLLPYAALWGFASSLSLLFSVMPFMLSTTNIGTLLTGPFIFATAIMITLALPLYTARFTSTILSTTLAVGAIVASVGTFGFGLYIEGSMVMAANGTRNSLGTMWSLDAVGANISFPVVSFLLGLLAAGSLTLDATIRPMIQRSISFTSVNLSNAMRSTIDMHAGLTCLRNLVAGAFIIGLPNAVWAWDGLRSAALGIGIAQFFVAGAVGCVWWQWQENVWRLDGKAIGAVDASALVLEKSYFDTS